MPCHQAYNKTKATRSPYHEHHQEEEETQNSRKTNRQIPLRHSRNLSSLADLLQMQHQVPHRRIIRIRQRIDDAVYRISSLVIIVKARGVDKGGVVLSCKQGVGQLAEELLEEAADAVDVVIEGGGVPEVGSLAWGC